MNNVGMATNGFSYHVYSGCFAFTMTHKVGALIFLDTTYTNLVPCFMECMDENMYHSGNKSQRSYSEMDTT